MFRSPGEGSRRPGLAAVGVVMLVFFGLSYSTFLGGDNLTSIARASSFVLIGAIGTMALLVSGNVDLSIGSQYALLSVVTAVVGVDTGSLLLCLLVALGLGAVLGAVNGLLVLVLDVSPLIVTLGTLGVYGGAAYAANHGQTVFGLPDSIAHISRIKVAGLSLTVILAVLVFAAGAFVLTATVPGLRLFAAGSNKQATQLVGVSLQRLTVGVFAANGLLIGIVALLSTAQLASGSPQVGANYELNVLAAVILGGVAFTGGRGHPFGVFVAVFDIGILNAGLIFMGVNDWWQQVAQGGLLLIALAADQAVVVRRDRRVRLGDVPSGPLRATPVAERRVRGEAGEARTVLAVRDLSVRYAGVRALDQVSLEVRSGEIICLVGDNGAGKSTLAKAISGATRPSSGSVQLDGRLLHANAGLARRMGVETVFQDLALCPNLNVADNLALGQEPRTVLGGVLRVRDLPAAEAVARARLDELGVALSDIRRPVRFLSGGERQLVQILRVMRERVRLVIMDEPTSALGLVQAMEVRELVKAIATAGTPVLLITHDVEEVFDVADRVVVLQRGQLVFDGPIEDVSRIELLRMMSGKTRVQAAQILDAVGAERRRIERDLHDGAQQGLVTAALMLNMAAEQLRKREGEGDQVVKLLRTSSDTLQSALGEMRAFSRGLQSGVLERDGLVGAVRVLTDRAPVLADLRASEVPRLAPAIEQAAYFAVAEAFTNALKYAGATRIVIVLEARADELFVSVHDDGVGFADTGEGSGLQGLQDRVAPVGGRLSIESTLGEGSTISAHFPLTAATLRAPTVSAPTGSELV